MEFEVGKKIVAGSAGSILQNEDVAAVYGLFGDKVLDTFGIDIRTKRTFMGASTLRQVQGFVNDYGKDDAMRIVRIAFDIKRKGRFKGRAVGASLFAKNMRWYADQLLLEGGGDDKPDKTGSGFWAQ